PWGRGETSGSVLFHGRVAMTTIDSLCDNPDGITDVHGTPVHDELACEEDCLNCGEHVGPDGDRVVIARVTKQGELDETDSWRVCPDCSSNTSIRQAVAATLR